MANDFASVLTATGFGQGNGEYDKFIRLANRLIIRKGRDVELLKDTANALIDPAKPHLGRKPKTSTTIIKAVFDQPSLFQRFSQSTDDSLIVDSEWTALIPTAGLVAAPSVKDKIRMLGATYSITAQVTIAPGNEPVMFVALLSLVGNIVDANTL